MNSKKRKIAQQQRVSFDNPVFTEKYITEYKALYNFKKETIDELGMNKGDLIVVLEPLTAAKENSGWILVKNLTSNNIGF